MKDIDDIIGLSAICHGVVEHGTVEVLIDKTKIEFTVEDSSDGFTLILLDTNTPEVIALLKEYGAELEEDNNEIIINGELKEYIYRIYTKTGESTSAMWSNKDYEEEDEDIDEEEEE